jgi:hypothetical protein
VADYDSALAGYSGTPLPKKLGIAEGAVISFDSAPESFGEALGPLPGGVRVRKTSAGHRDLIVSFVTRRSSLERRIGRLGDSVFPNGSLWIAWPKRSSGVETDMTEDVVREVALPLGLVDNKVCGIDETWSGLRLVWRRERRLPAQDGGF